MKTTELSKLLSRSLGPALTRKELWLALVLSAGGTALLGGILLALLDNVWWLTLGGLVSLFGGGLYMGWRDREPEPLNGTILAVVYFLLAVVFIFAMELAQELPDPLPGLAIGDSTFFFVSPLFVLASGVAGSVVGGLLPRGKGPGAG